VTALSDNPTVSIGYKLMHQCSDLQF
jgi:hypothetical protein